MNKVLITGAKGYVSTSLADWLRNKHNFECTQISLRDDKWKTIDLSSYDCIVHIAGIVPKEDVKTEDYYKINTELTKQLSIKCKNDKIKHLIYLSSMAVYGIEQSIDVKEGTITKNTKCNPKSDYGKSKYLAEQELSNLEDENFKVSIIRVPSIYGKNKTEYIDQFKYLGNKFVLLPKCFTNNYKSSIYIVNLCELIYLIINNKEHGIITPDDGEHSAYEYCKAMYPEKRSSRLFGLIVELFLKNNNRIIDYYGTVAYLKEIADAFDGKYRVVSFEESIRKSYEI